jgi:hypothetical protein
MTFHVKRIAKTVFPVCRELTGNEKRRLIMSTKNGADSVCQNTDI